MDVPGAWGGHSSSAKPILRANSPNVTSSPMGSSTFMPASSPRRWGFRSTMTGGCCESEDGELLSESDDDVPLELEVVHTMLSKYTLLRSMMSGTLLPSGVCL